MEKFFILIVLVVLWFNTSLAADYYVRPHATDGNCTYGDCTGLSYENAWEGFFGGDGIPISWGTVDSGNGKLFIAGTHYEQMNINRSGEEGAPIHITSCTVANGASTNDPGTIDGDYTRDYNVYIYGGDPDPSYITIDGLTLTAADNTAVWVNECLTDIIVQNCTITEILGTDNYHGNGIRYDSFEDGDTFTIANNTINNVRHTGIWIREGGTVANINGSKIYGNDIKRCGMIGISVNNVNYLDIYNNDLYDMSNTIDHGGGISLGSASYNEIYNNVVEKVEDPSDSYQANCYKLYVGSNNKWYNNIATDCKVGIHLDNNSPHPDCDVGVCDGNEVYYNIVYDCAIGIFLEQKHTNAVVYNNVSCSNSNALHIGGLCSTSNSDILVKNNIFSNNSNAALYVLNDGTGLTLDYNLYYDADPTGPTWHWDADQNGAGDNPVVYCISSGGSCDSSHLWANYQSDKNQDTNSPTPADPLFINASGYNFHLQSISPAINAGIDVGLTEDYEGKPVPQGLGVDIGAFEYQTDTTFPTGTITINDGATVTHSLHVLLTLFATDNVNELDVGALMTFSNDNQNWSDPEPYTNSKMWTLSPGEGVKTVYVKFRDPTGSWMREPAHDQIIYQKSEINCDDPKKLQPVAIIASSQFGPFFAKEKAVDGNPSTTWSTFVSFFKKDEFITLDLGEIKKLSGLNMFASKLFGTDFFPTNFQIEVSRDDITWEVVSTEYGYTPPVQPTNPDSWDFNSLECRYVRVNITRAKTLLFFLHIAQIAEIEVYGCDITNSFQPLTEGKFSVNDGKEEQRNKKSPVKPTDLSPGKPSTPGRPTIIFLE
jgi:hypothetical protein